MNSKKIVLSILDSTTEFGHIIKLDIGSKNIAKRFFKNSIPKLYEVELAIMHINDSITNVYPLWKSMTKNCRLILTANYKHLALLAEIVNNHDYLKITNIENAFTQFKQLISTQSDLPEIYVSHRDAISLLIIVREIMQLLNINEIELINTLD